MAHHLTLEERERLAHFKSAGLTQAEIARELKRHPSTVSRELSRNGQDQEYWPVAAQRQVEDRRRSRSFPRKMDCQEVSQFVREGLANYWSPEQIAGRASRQFPRQPGRHICYQTIYTWIDQDESRAHWEDFLRHRGKKRTQPEKRGQIANRVDVAGRPKVVGERRRFGDWEGDTVVGRHHQGGVVTLVERKSRFTLVGKVRDLKARTVRYAIKQKLQAVPQPWRKTMTFDNGKEFAEHCRLSEQLALAIYFAKPYAAWQRGTNENTNGLLRQFHPKGTDFLKVRPSALQETQNNLNNRPRKCLGYRTPAEVLKGRLGIAFEI
jgi:transposase, IS30 family